ncbi:MAG: carbon-nitrogen hydrolase family protein [Methylococcales bacterium]|nr:carbon-nitrogen hydrolase family protein [Methylococcales bacterium]
MTICAAIQMTSSATVKTNLVEAEKLIAKASERGAQLVTLPENFALMGVNEFDKVSHKEVQGAGIIQDFLAHCALKYKVWLIGGTIPLVADDATKIRAACLVFNDNGDMLARYDKAHLFDVIVPDTGEKYFESNTIEPGHHPIIIESPFGKIGLGICYDLRFPQFFRYLAEQGAEIFIIPAAFTAKTGEAHWDVLLRARAIENLCYVIAPNQGGFHANGRQTYGHSMIVDPWGKILGCHKTGAGVVCADIDLIKLQKIRKNFPVLTHKRIISEKITNFS